MRRSALPQSELNSAAIAAGDNAPYLVMFMQHQMRTKTKFGKRTAVDCVANMLGSAMFSPADELTQSMWYTRRLFFSELENL
jgi:hypothetical protein